MVSDEVTDRQLLQRFVSAREETAFHALVRRHGPMVLGVCRRIVKNVDEADDAFQATFIILSRKAGDVLKTESIGPWLYRVAYHAALRTRSRLQQRRGREIPFEEPMHAGAEQCAVAVETAQEVRPVLDEELNRLPEKYRAPLVLCYLEGKTTDETARQLGCPRGTVAWRMSRGRDLLRNRLARRGLAATSVAVAAMLQQSSASAMSLALLQATCQLGAGKAVAGSAPAYAVANGALKTLTALKLKVAAGMALAVVAVSAAAVAVPALLAPPPATPQMVFQNFDGPSLAVNQEGEGFPTQDNGEDRAPVGGLSLDADAVSGKSLLAQVSAGRFRAHFMPQAPGGRRGFAREYTAAPSAWQFDTYDRFRFWIKAPASAEPHSTTGNANMNVCCYIKPAQTADGPNRSVEAVPYHHRINVPVTGHWTQVVLNAHPHLRLAANSEVAPFLPHPTGERGINYFDALSGFFIEDRQPPKAYPADYRLDEMSFFKAGPENDDQVFSITTTHVPEQNRVILTWSRPEAEDGVSHEVRYAFSDVHRLGWANAVAAPAGIVKPNGKGVNNGMTYETTALPLAGKSVLYLAIKPQNSERFSQVSMPLQNR
jgi:RNA polymerase sigma factor (sigma-70 family)